MDWSDLRYALAVARTGNVTDAARALGVAHTTVYRRINTLEERHDVRFFDRSKTPWELTATGRELLALGAELESRVDEFERRVRGHDRRLSGPVSIATVEALALALTRELHRFRAIHPDIQVVLAVTPVPVRVGDGADIALRVTRSPPESLRGRRLGTVGFAVYAAPSLLAKGPVDLASADWICFHERLGHTPQAKWEQAHVDDAQIVMRTDSRAVFFEAVRLGEGVGVLPCGLAAEAPALQRVSELMPELALPLWLLTHQDLAHTPRIRVLMEFIAEAFAHKRELIEGR